MNLRWLSANSQYFSSAVFGETQDYASASAVYILWPGVVVAVRFPSMNKVFNYLLNLKPFNHMQTKDC